MRYTNFLRRAGQDESGATAIEYGLIAALIVVSMLASLSSLAGVIQKTWTNLNTTVSAAVSQAGA